MTAVDRPGRLAIIVPVLNEAADIEAALGALQGLRKRGARLIVVDGGSQDGTPARAGRYVDEMLTVERGRARQMNAGAAAASGDALLFLHADTCLPAGADELILDALKKNLWGRFDVAIEGRSALLPVIAFFMNRRSRLTGIATGDQAIFVRRDAFPGFPEIALMEDVAFSKAMKRRAPPACLRDRVSTSGRRWERNGVVRTVILMWRLRLAYFLGASPDELARQYANEA